MKQIVQKIFNKLKILPAQAWLLMAVVMLGAGLRFYRLTYFDLWYDEVLSIREALNSARFISELHASTVAPLYFLVLALWIKIFGFSIYAVRFLSAAPSALSIVLLYLLGKHYFDTKTGLLTALILALAPLHIWYAQEARMYSLSVFFCLLMVYAGMRLEKQQNFCWLMSFVCIAIVSVYLNYFALFILLACLILQHNKMLFASRRYRTGMILLVIGILPCIFIACLQLHNIQRSFWIHVPQMIDLQIACANFIAGYNGTIVTISASVVLLFGLIFFALIKELKNTQYWFFVCCGVMPIIALFILSQFVPVFVVKALIIFTPFVYLLLVRGFFTIPLIWLRVLFLGMVFGIMILSAYNYYKGLVPAPERFSAGVQLRVNIKEAVSFIKEQWREGDIIVHSNVHTLFPFLYAMRAEKDVVYMYLHMPGAQQDKYWRDMYDMDRKFKGSPLKQFQYEVRQVSNSTFFYSQRRMWLISSNWRVDGLMDEYALAVRKQIMSRYQRVQSVCIDKMYIDLFLLDQPAQVAVSHNN